MNIPQRRRREGKTHYCKRMKLLVGGRPRIIIRRSNKALQMQYVMSKEAQDRVVLGITSKILLEYGWLKEKQGSLKSVPAAYLTGLVFGKMAIRERLGTNPIIDLGMLAKVHKSRVAACMKGLKDAGITLHSKKEKEIFPNEERLFGKHLSKEIQEMISKVKERVTKE